MSKQDIGDQGAKGRGGGGADVDFLDQNIFSLVAFS